MDLLETLTKVTASQDLQKLGSQFGLDSNAMGKVLGQVVPALGRGIQKNTQSSGGLDSLVNALRNGGHQRYVENVEEAVSPAGINEGKGILGHIFGSKDVSRNVAAHASQASGVSPDLIKQMLPVVATMVMGSLSKQTNGGQQLSQQSSGGMLDGLAGMLDSNNDGSAMDDVLNLAKRFF